MDETFDTLPEPSGEGEPGAAAEPEEIGGAAGRVEGEQVVFARGLAGSVSAQQNAQLNHSVALVSAAGQDLSMTGSLALAGFAGRDLEANNSGALALTVGGNAETFNGGALISTVGGNLELTNGGALFAVVGGQTAVQHGTLGIVLSGSVHLGEDTRVMINTPQAIALGAAFGAVAAVLGWLLRRR